MIFRALDDTGDWTFGKGANNFLRGRDAIQTNIETRLKSWRNDCFFATAEGVDYTNLLDIGTQSLLDNDIRRVIFQSEGVLRLISYSSELTRDQRLFSARAEILTIFGQVTLEI